MSTPRIGIVWNPAKTKKSRLEKGLAHAIGGGEAPEVHWVETSKEDPGRTATRQALDAGCTLILAAGGDGTVRAVAEYLAESQADADLGIIPLGTGNLLARNLGVPLIDIAAAFRRVLKHPAREIDFAWAEVTTKSGTQRHGFAVMAGFGIDAHMITETDEDLKSRAGWLAYVESLGRALSASEVIHLRFAVGDNEVEKDAHTVLVGNCGTLQAGIELLPDAHVDDGLLDLLVLSADSVAGWFDTMRTMVRNNPILRKLGGDQELLSSETAVHRKITELTIELAEPREFEVDGDTVGEATRIEFSVQPGALRVR